MHFLIVGAGGIGAYYGARLIEAGHEVLFVARGEHLKAMQQRGLKVQHPALAFDAPVNTTDQGSVDPL